MRIASNITLIACLSVLSLQLLWIYNSYLSYKASFITEVNSNLLRSIGKEVGYRTLDTDLRRRQDKIYYKFADEMTPQEREVLKGGDTLNISISNSNRVADTMQDVITQSQQDLLLGTNPLKLSVLDTIFVSLFNQKIMYCIKSFDKDTLMTGQVGNMGLGKSRIILSELVPVGTKGLQYVQAEVQVPITAYLQNMILILCASLLLMIVVMAILFVQFVLLRKKTDALTARETGINGTIHDLKAPLENIITLLYWITERERDEKMQEQINKVIIRAQFLIQDIQQILMNPIKGRLLLNITDILPDELIEQAKHKISSKLQAKPHSLVVENDMGEEPLWADTLYLGSALKNLIENSLKYSNNGVLICVRFYKAGGYQVIEVKDNGWGIDKKYLKKIFEPYYQIQRIGKGRSGYGIGLSFVKLVVSRHGGKIEIKSTINLGTTIKCYLPCKK